MMQTEKQTSWGTGVAEHVYRNALGRLRRPGEIVTSDAAIIPSARHLEQAMLAGPERLEAAVRKVA
jgi:pyruvate/2-oxoglutarate/acetoin dehydrogenase E1 component